jgi:tripartite-type tricarboxylate transporter receptor subunit TctC
MKWATIKACVFSLVAVFAASAPLAGNAADFPNRPVRLVVPLAAGSATDLLARQMARWLEVEWKQPVIVENRPGAGSIVATDYVTKQPADGHTLLLTGSSLVIAPLIDKNVTFRLDKDLNPVARIAVLRIVLATNTAVPANTIQDFAALSRQNPGKMNYAGLGRTSIIDTGVEVLKKSLKMDLTPIAYKGAAEHNTALIRNDVQLVWGGSKVMKEQVATGKVKILAAVSEHRFTDLPDVPSIVEAGHVGFIPKVWTGLIAPAGTPTAIQDQINADVNRVIARPEAVKLLQDVLGNDPAPLPNGAFAEEVRKESKFWGDLFKELKIEPQ